MGGMRFFGSGNIRKYFPSGNPLRYHKVTKLGTKRHCSAGSLAKGCIMFRHFQANYLFLKEKKL